MVRPYLGWQGLLLIAGILATLKFVTNLFQISAILSFGTLVFRSHVAGPFSGWEGLLLIAGHIDLFCKHIAVGANFSYNDFEI